MVQTPGLHHITAITADPQKNADFYEGFLGQRMIKKTVNFDDPNAYHLYYGDYIGTPGTALTFFYWAGMPPGKPGMGIASGFSYRINPHSLSYWKDRAAEFSIEATEFTNEFGEQGLQLHDFDGLPVQLIVAEGTDEVVPWQESIVPNEHQLLGFYSVQLSVSVLESILMSLTEGLGLTEEQTIGNVTRFACIGQVGRYVDVTATEGQKMAQQGAGSIHHIAFQATDDEMREGLREQVNEIGVGSTGLIDRFYFHATYFMSPAAILFEIATNDIGFTIDEPAESLGEHLLIPEHYEHLRAQIEATLVPINLPRNNAA